MPSDANLVLQASSTVSSAGAGASSFNGAALTIGSTPRRGLKARVVYSGGSTSAGSAAATWQVDASYDGASTWVSAVGTSDPVNLLIAAKGGELFIPFEVSQRDLSKPVQVRLTYNNAAGSATPASSITYFSDVTLSRP